MVEIDRNECQLAQTPCDTRSLLSSGGTVKNRFILNVLTSMLWSSSTEVTAGVCLFVYMTRNLGKAPNKGFKRQAGNAVLLQVYLPTKTKRR